MSSDNRAVPSSPASAGAAAASTHYENFPVASWLCPRRLRPPITAIYWFARVADDIADEGDASATARLDDLAAYRADLDAVAAGEPPSRRWPGIFEPLARAIDEWQLPIAPLRDLIEAFQLDVRKTHAEEGYADRAELLGYCRLSANPVGRLLLHLWGVRDTLSLARSDAICSALQLINFWQDLGVDLARGRHYLPGDDCQAYGVVPTELALPQDGPALRALVAAQVRWARELMHEGAPLVHAVPGRAGWELRAVVQGGLRVLDRIESIGFDTLNQRPVVGAADAPVILWRMLRM